MNPPIFLLFKNRYFYLKQLFPTRFFLCCCFGFFSCFSLDICLIIIGRASASPLLFLFLRIFRQICTSDERVSEVRKNERGVSLILFLEEVYCLCCYFGFFSCFSLDVCFIKMRRACESPYYFYFYVFYNNYVFIFKNRL